MTEPWSPSRDFIVDKERMRAEVRALEEREAARKREQYERRKSTLYRAGGVVGRNGVWSATSSRGERTYTIHVFPDQRGADVGWAGVCDCQAIAQCWHKDAAIERELEYLQDLRDREAWQHEQADAIAPLAALDATGPASPAPVEDLGGGRYRVPSDTHAGLSYNVQVVGIYGACDCVPGSWGECKHIRRVQELRNDKRDD